MNFKLQISGLVLIVLLINSCLRVETGIHLKKNGTVSVSLDYTFSGDIADFGRGFGSDEPWFLPLTEKDFVQQTIRHPGVKLKDYKTRTNSAGEDIIKVELEGKSIEDLSAFLNLDMKLEERDGGGTYTLNIPSFPPVPGGSEEMELLLENVAGDTSFLFSFNPPGSIKSADSGIIKDGEAVLEVLLKDILSENAPQTWIVTW